MAAGAEFMGRAIHSTEPEGMLKQSADVMRQMLASSPSFAKMRSTVTDFDNITHWVWTEYGAQVRLRVDCINEDHVRLSQKLYCTKSFLELVFTLALEPSSKTFARRVRLLLLKHFVTVNAPAPFILPNKATVMKILMKCADTFSHVVHDGLKRLAASRDFRAVSIDGTYKFLMSVQGQEPHGRRREKVHRRMKYMSLSRLAR